MRPSGFSISVTHELNMLPSIHFAKSWLEDNPLRSHLSRLAFETSSWEECPNWLNFIVLFQDFRFDLECLYVLVIIESLRMHAWMQWYYWCTCLSQVAVWGCLDIPTMEVQPTFKRMVVAGFLDSYTTPCWNFFHFREIIGNSLQSLWTLRAFKHNSF